MVQSVLRFPVGQEIGRFNCLSRCPAPRETFLEMGLHSGKLPFLCDYIFNNRVFIIKGMSRTGCPWVLCSGHVTCGVVSPLLLTLSGKNILLSLQYLFL